VYVGSVRSGSAPLASLALLAAIAAALPASAKRPSHRTTFLLARSYDGRFADAPARDGAISHDQRVARYMAFDSDATTLVKGDINGVTDVFLVRRKPPWGANGTPWVPGSTEIVSLAPNGAAANGPSYRPSVDGDSHHRPHCVAFVSDASNLVPGDTNGKADAFVRDMRTGKTTRVSVSSRGEQSDGTTSEVAIDGACARVAFVSDASNLALTRTSRRAWAGARTNRPRPGVRQVYVRVLAGDGPDAGFKGLTLLTSANRGGHAGNASSYELSFARSGKAVAFTSEATNLARGDRNRRPDVYLRTLTRRFVHLGHGRGVQTLHLDTRLVSANARGRAGTGASQHPSVSDTGRYVAYETDASDLLDRDRNGVTDVARAAMTTAPPSQRWVSRSAFSGRGNGPSRRPAISDAGQFVLFESDATNFRPSAQVRSDGNGVTDVFLWNGRTGNVSLESRDSSNHYLPAPSGAPVTSSRGNYVLFQGGNPRKTKMPEPPPAVQHGPFDPIICLLNPQAANCQPTRREPPPPDNEPQGTEPNSPMPPGVVPQLFVRYLGPQ
jgi:TolB protein